MRFMNKLYKILICSFSNLNWLHTTLLSFSTKNLQEDTKNDSDIENFFKNVQNKIKNIQNTKM